MNRIVHKVAAYITCQGRLLVFREVDFPEAGIQVPGGTVEEGENLDEAVLREASEETGLDNLRMESYLGTRVYDLRPINGMEVDYHRHCYHLSLPEAEERGRWRHWEKSPSDGSDPILFELYWVEIPDGIPALAGGFGDMLEELAANVQRLAGARR